MSFVLCEENNKTATNNLLYYYYDRTFQYELVLCKKFANSLLNMYKISDVFKMNLCLEV